MRNRQTWTVTAMSGSGDLTVTDDEHGTVTLPSSYVRHHVELGWAVTGYGNQGVTTDHSICVIEPSSSRAGIYVGMTRGRGHNVAWVLDPVGNLDPEEALAAAIARPPNVLTAHATRVRLYEANGLTPPAREVEPLLPDDPTARIRARLDRLQQRPPVERSLGR